MVYNLGVIDNPNFKLSFNLWNERGMPLAEIFVSTSLGTHSPWIPVHSKKDKCSYAQVARIPPLTGANQIPLGNSSKSSATVHSPAPGESPCTQGQMAYRFIDPEHFLPRGCTRVQIEGRKTMMRAVLGRPDVSFQSIRELVDDFLRNHKKLGFRVIQPCPHGQAYVRLNYYHDRDFLVQNSPHAYGNYQLTFREHNRAWNNRTTVMNYDVWLMLIGFNIDYWEHSDIEKAISEFGKIFVWEEDHSHLARVIVKARVVDLTEIPLFLVCSEGENFEGDSWTAQCEILKVNMLGGGPPVEDDPPNGPDGLQPNLFEFFGFGQPGNGPNNGPGLPPNDQANDGVQDMDADAWELWPEQPNNIVLPEQQPPQVNVAPQIDLNAPLEDDLGGIEELIQIAEHMDAQQVFGPHPEEVIDAGINSDVESDNEHDMNVQQVNPLHEIEVFIPLEQINTNEFHPDELMDHDPSDDDSQKNAENFRVDNLQVGFVELFEPPVDPIFSSSASMPKMHPDLVRLWANFFSAYSGNPVQVPLQWSEFITALLASPVTFSWTKQLLQSEAWKLFNQSPSNLTFSLPETYPKIQLSKCQEKLTLPVIPDELDSSPSQGSALDSCLAKASKGGSSPCTPEELVKKKVSSSPGPWAKTFLQKADKEKIEEFLEDPLKRRNPQCSSKGCLGCKTIPPSLSPSVIKNLGSSFCKLDEQDLSVAALQKKKKPSAPAQGKKKLPVSTVADKKDSLLANIGKKASKKKLPSDENVQDDTSKDKKKSKK
ncbi:hypothetical protein PVAP13_3NG178000 [Panicum virgatum]|uniref:DUF7597 domain-containing protein n=1 Tax=Panicum virgatum TaxID=38727 RepID=A0A8T0U8U8_PANVG|nr:hypothetical protein PVAP13_3NG178000 [Panicum virgatum]